MYSLRLKRQKTICRFPPKILLWGILFLLAAGSAAQAAEVSAPAVAVSAHRGANDVAPENTLAAYRAAIDLGADFIEIDIHMTQDGQLVSIHDSTLDRTTDGKGPVREITFEALRKLSAGRWFGEAFAGEKVPTLEEICRLVRDHPGPKGQVALYFDWKDADAQPWIEMLRKYDLLKTTVVYGSAGELAPLKKLVPELKLMPGLGSPEQLDAIAEKVHPYAFDAAWRILSPELIQQAHARGIKIFSDAMGEHETEADYLQAIAWGIDLIQTDHVTNVLKAIEKSKARRK